MVFVVDKNKKPLALCHSAKARKLLDRQEAVIINHYPFVIRLKKETEGEVKKTYCIKIDPGAKFTGLAILNNNEEIVFCAVIQHKAFEIKEKLTSRASLRRGRRARNTRYRKPRFSNRVSNKKAGWLPPSLRSRIDNITNWVKKLMAICPIGEIYFENVKFDTQLMENPDVNGVEYQRGELYGFEIQEYLREKTGFKCAYCGKEGTKEKLEIEHIIPKSRGGSNRVSNLTLACHKCNQKKGNKTAKEFGYPQVEVNAKKPLKDTAIMNSSRKAMFIELKKIGLPIKTGTGGRTKWNRVNQKLPKTHYFDASCVGIIPEKLEVKTEQVLNIKAVGRGKYKRTDTDKYGFPRAYRARLGYFQGFKSGDVVKSIYGIKSIVSVRAKGSFTLENKKNVSPKKCQLIQRCNGYVYKSEINEER
jgi:5-methylcytosine-specific restriction endonuclease McrA